VAGLEKAWLEQTTRDRSFQEKWDIVLLWSEGSRYITTNPDMARDLIEAVGNRNHGVLGWLKLHW